MMFGRKLTRPYNKASFSLQGACKAAGARAPTAGTLGDAGAVTERNPGYMLVSRLYKAQQSELPWFLTALVCRLLPPFRVTLQSAKMYYIICSLSIPGFRFRDFPQTYATCHHYFFCLFSIAFYVINGIHD